jgi:hypothetical protein
MLLGLLPANQAHRRDMFDALPSAYIGTGEFRICRCGEAD